MKLPPAPILKLGVALVPGDLKEKGLEVVESAPLRTSGLMAKIADCFLPGVPVEDAGEPKLKAGAGLDADVGAA